MAGSAVDFTRRAVETTEGAGARIRRLFPTREFRNLDPFVLLDEFWVEEPAEFPMHPHGGFEFVTYMLEGALRHVDSMGNERVVPAGGVQRAVTGSGIRHSEMPAAEEISHGLQLWVNLPRRLKGAEPEYQYAEPGEFPVAVERGARLRTIVGEGSPLETKTPMQYIEAEFEMPGTFSKELPRGFNSFLYLIEGGLSIWEEGIGPHEAAVLKPGAELVARTDGPARFVLVSGRPHGEPIRLRGSYVE